MRRDGEPIDLGVYKQRARRVANLEQPRRSPPRPGAIEVAAEALAHGLLTSPLTAGVNRDREFEQFEALTGFPTPRLDEVA